MTDEIIKGKLHLPFMIKDLDSMSYSHAILEMHKVMAHLLGEF